MSLAMSLTGCKVNVFAYISNEQLKLNIKNA